MKPAPPVMQARFIAARRSASARVDAGGIDYSVKPAADRVAVEHLHGLERELLEVLAEQSSFLSRSWRHGDDVAADLVGLDEVQHLARRGPDHSARGAAAMISTASRMIGTGSTPASAIRPAKTEMYEGAPSFTAAVDQSRPGRS